MATGDQDGETGACWLHPHIQVLPSAIHGRGPFAAPPPVVVAPPPVVVAPPPAGVYAPPPVVYAPPAYGY